MSESEEEAQAEDESDDELAPIEPEEQEDEPWAT
jgi:hypothetical protein